MTMSPRLTEPCSARDSREATPLHRCADALPLVRREQLFDHGQQCLLLVVDMTLQHLHELPQGMAELGVVMDLSGILQEWRQPAPDEVYFQMFGFQLPQDFIEPVTGRVLHAGEQGMFLVVVVQGERGHELLPELPGMHPEITTDRLQLDLFNQLCHSFAQREKVFVVVPDDEQCIAEVRCGLCVTRVWLHGSLPGGWLNTQRDILPGGAIPGKGRAGARPERCP